MDPFSLFSSAFGAAGSAMSAPPATSGSDQQVRNETHVDASTGDFMVAGRGATVEKADAASGVMGNMLPIIALVAAAAIAISLVKK